MPPSQYSYELISLIPVQSISDQSAEHTAPQQPFPAGLLWLPVAVCDHQASPCTVSLALQPVHGHKEAFIHSSSSVNTGPNIRYNVGG